MVERPRLSAAVKLLDDSTQAAAPAPPCQRFRCIDHHRDILVAEHLEQSSRRSTMVDEPG
ncbi:hypothetical protein ACFVAV_03250 [Nocardia sp. NPDC057663]|uniref:hypothetical protein n=1 Tax=Nocardia sp. NPDC057663 TaxID=3346201 RepID=UPI003671B2C1